MKQKLVFIAIVYFRMISSIFLSEFNGPYSRKSMFFVNTVKILVRVFAKDKVFLKRR